MGGSQSTEIGQPSKLSAPLPGLRWELQSRPNGLVKIEDFRLVEEVSDTVLRCANPNPNPNMAHARCTPRLTLHHVLHTPQAIDCSQLEDGEVIVKCPEGQAALRLRSSLAPVAVLGERVGPSRQSPMNLHRHWPRSCGWGSSAGFAQNLSELPAAYVRRVETMAMRRQAHWEHGGHDPLAASRHRSTGPPDILRAARVQACLYTTLDAWAQLAREENIRWSASGGSLFGAWCYNSVAVWDDDIDISVPEQDCKKLDRIWHKAGSGVRWDRANRRHAPPVVTGWRPRYFRHLRLTVWRAEHGPAASNGHTKLTAWGQAGTPRTPVLHGNGRHGQQQFLLGIDVMCTNHQPDLTLPGGKKVPAMKNVTDDLIYGRVAPVEFGPTTIPLVTPSVALEYTKAQGWDTGCGEMPPMSEKARVALASYSAMGPTSRALGQRASGVSGTSVISVPATAEVDRGT